jgi:formylglycine-generating enzyme required for sulfatase activity
LKKQQFTFILFLLIGVFLSTNILVSAQETGWDYSTEKFEVNKKSNFQGYKNLPKVARQWFKGVKFIQGGTFIMGRVSQNITATESDTTLLIGSIPRRVTVSSFFISEHEVTNAEYREFTNWIKTRSAMDILANYYPERCLPNGRYNENILIDWRDIVLDSLLYYPENESYYRRKEIDTRKLVYTYQYEEFNDSLYRINYSDTIGNDSSLLWNRDWSDCMELKEVSIAVYPDTLCWINDFSYSYNEPMTKMYFWHPAYDYYPVVGVSYKQAQAYCNWRTDRLNESILIAEKILDKSSYYFSTYEFLKDTANWEYMEFLYPYFRLPTEAEWEYAACYTNEDGYNDAIYPWEAYSLFNDKAEYKANFGNIDDKNGVRIKSFADDGGHHTTIIASYEANQKGLYDMAGNVAEWVIDRKTESEHNFAVRYDDTRQEAFTKTYQILSLDIDYWRYLDTTNVFDRQKIECFAEEALHNAIVLHNTQNARVVKGGSWADPALYLMPGTQTIFNENKSSSRIGFRIAMTKVGSPFQE